MVRALLGARLVTASDLGKSKRRKKKETKKESYS
jgi:hypothetical protein